MFFKTSLRREGATLVVEGAVGLVVSFPEEGLGEEGGVQVLPQVGRRLGHWFYNFVNCIKAPFLEKEENDKLSEAPDLFDKL